MRRERAAVRQRFFFIVLFDGCCVFSELASKVYLGCFEECTRQELPVIALYVLFIDPDFADESYEDEPERELVAAPETGFCNVYDKEGQFRASIAADGTVSDRFGDVIGLLDLEGKRAASPAGQLVARLIGTQVRCNSLFQ